MTYKRFDYYNASSEDDKTLEKEKGTGSTPEEDSNIELAHGESDKILKRDHSGHLAWIREDDITFHGYKHGNGRNPLLTAAPYYKSSRDKVVDENRNGNSSTSSKTLNRDIQPTITPHGDNRT